MSRTTAYLCLGSNIEPEQNIRFAMQRLHQDFQVEKTSNLYKSQAVGFNGDDFLNLALSIKTEFSLQELLAYTDALEREAGRVRVRRGRFDSRTLDVDVVMFGDLHGQHSGREWPSEDIDKDAHVLLPISEIAGSEVHPASGVRFDTLWQEFDKSEQALCKVDQIW